MDDLQPQTQKKGWWGRNWKWVVPVGCLGLFVLFAAFLSGLFFLIFGIIKSSDVYKDALVRVKANPVVQDRLGQPMEAGLIVTGSINVNGPSGEANLAIPISGPKGKGTVYVGATKSAGQWTFATLVVEVRKTGERIDVLETAKAGGQAERAP